MAQRPRPLGAGGIPIDAVEHAGIVQIAIRHRKAPVDLLGAERGQHAQERRPMGPHLPVGIHHLVEDAGERPIARQQARQAVADWRRQCRCRARRPRCRNGLACGNKPSGRVSEIERQRIFDRAFERGQARESARSMAMILESRAPASLRLVGIHRKSVIAAPARMRHMVDAAAERTVAPGVDDVEGERRVGVDGRMQR